jgi:aldehyde:ferredoxin oxidoreductase
MIDRRSEPEYGGGQAHHVFLEELLGGIARGTSIFSQGTARAVEKLGQSAADLYNGIFTARGYPNHHVRGVGEALHWATDTRDPFNSCHDYLRFGDDAEIADWFGVPGGYFMGDEDEHRNIYDGTERETVWVQNHQCLRNSLLICEFGSWPTQYFHPPEMDIRIFESRLLSVVTGVDTDVETLWEKGERIWNLRRAIMVLREGRSRKDDMISRVCFERKNELFSSHMSEPLDEGEWRALKDRYYELRGWNVADGRPSRARLEELGMKRIADDLHGAGKIG